MQDNTTSCIVNKLQTAVTMALDIMRHGKKKNQVIYRQTEMPARPLNNMVTGQL